MDPKERQSLLGIQTMKFKQSLDTYGFTNRWFLGFALGLTIVWVVLVWLY